MIPNIIHFIFGLTPDFGGRPFSFVHYLAVKAAFECNRPDKIYIHYLHEPSGEWWERARPFLTLNKVTAPKEIFGNPLLHYAHIADIVRLEVLLEHGGIYLDMDVICVRSFRALLNYSTVMGGEREGGLCNAVILAEKNADFTRKWYESYVSFRSRGKDEYWSEHSVEVPYLLSKKIPRSIHVVSKFRFFWPSYEKFWLLFDVGSNRSLLERILSKLMKPVSYLIIRNVSFSVHLYESIWWDRYLKELSPESMRAKSRCFEWLFRRYI